MHTGKEKIIAKQNVTNGCRVYIENIKMIDLLSGGAILRYGGAIYRPLYLKKCDKQKFKTEVLRLDTG